MSCFWDAILNKIKIDDFKKLKYSGKPGPKEFADLLKNHNIITENVLWNSQILTKKQLAYYTKMSFWRGHKYR